MNITVETATAAHVPLLLGGLSEATSGEIKKLIPEADLSQVLIDAIGRAKEADVFFANGKIICLIGIGIPNVLSGEAFPWMIPHKQNLEEVKWQFLAASKRWVEAANERYPVLTNVVIATNTQALKWLKWVGFTIGDPIKYNGVWVRPYRKERK